MEGEEYGEDEHEEVEDENVDRENQYESDPSNNLTGQENHEQFGEDENEVEQSSDS